MTHESVSILVNLQNISVTRNNKVPYQVLYILIVDITSKYINSNFDGLSFKDIELDQFSIDDKQIDDKQIDDKQ